MRGTQQPYECYCQYCARRRKWEREDLILGGCALLAFAILIAYVVLLVRFV